MEALQPPVHTFAINCKYNTGAPPDLVALEPVSRVGSILVISQLVGDLIIAPACGLGNVTYSISRNNSVNVL